MTRQTLPKTGQGPAVGKTGAKWPPSASRGRAAARGADALFLDGVRAGIGCPPVDLSVVSGATVTAFGNDAATLSRLLDMIAGFHPMLGGRVVVNGRDVSLLEPGRRGVALVSVRDPLFEHLTVSDNLAFPLRARREDRTRVMAGIGRMMALLGLDGLGDRRPEALSPEQRMRVMLGRALLTEPEVLLLDDPLAGFELRAARRLSALLGTVSRALGLTVLHAVSRREDALRPGGPIAVFQGEVLLQCAPADRLYEQPASPEVAIAFGQANALTGQVLEVVDDVARIHLACGGVAEAMASAELRAGEACVLCIRPDRVAPFFGAQGLGLDDDLPPLRGTLAHSLHLGDHIRMRVRFADGSEIELNRPPLQARQIPSIGANVQIAWPAGHAVAFPLGADLY